MSSIVCSKAEPNKTCEAIYNYAMPIVIAVAQVFCITVLIIKRRRKNDEIE